MEWNDATIKLLRELWAVGYSTQEIGRRMGCSKNAVVGKAHRLGLARPSPIIRTGIPRPPRPKLVRTDTLKVRAAKPVPAPAVRKVRPEPLPGEPRPPAQHRHVFRSVTPEPLPLPPPVVEPGPPLPLRVEPREARTCEWVVVLKPRPAPPIFCEAPCDGRRSYCATHAALCFVPAPALKKRDEGAYA